MARKRRLKETLLIEAARGFGISLGLVTLGIAGVVGYEMLFDARRHHDELRVATPLPGTVVARQATDANDKQVAPEAGLEDSGDIPNAGTNGGSLLRPATKPLVAMPMPTPPTVMMDQKRGRSKQPIAVKEPVNRVVFPDAAPVRHESYVLVASRRGHRRHWIPVLQAANPQASILERPARDLTAAAPIDPNLVVGAPQRNPFAVVAANPGPVSPGVREELQASRRVEGEGALSAVEKPVSSQVGRPAIAAAHTATPKTVQHSGAALLPHQRLELARQAAGHQVAAVAPARLHAGKVPVRLSQLKAPHQPMKTVAAVTARPAAQGEGTSSVALLERKFSDSQTYSPVSGARPTITAAIPAYDARRRTLQVHLEGRLADGPLAVHYLNNGRAYVDIAGAHAPSPHTTYVSTADGAFQHGAIADRPQSGGARLSFDLRGETELNARVEGGKVVLQAVPRKKRAP